jgi:hypothetical protein
MDELRTLERACKENIGGPTYVVAPFKDWLHYHPTECPDPIREWLRTHYPDVAIERLDSMLESDYAFPVKDEDLGERLSEIPQVSQPPLVRTGRE